MFFFHFFISMSLPKVLFFATEGFLIFKGSEIFILNYSSSIFAFKISHVPAEKFKIKIAHFTTEGLTTCLFFQPKDLRSRSHILPLKDLRSSCHFFQLKDLRCSSQIFLLTCHFFQLKDLRCPSQIFLVKGLRLSSHFSYSKIWF